MKIFKVDLKKAKAKKRVGEGATPPLSTVVAKRPRVALGGPSALTRALVVHPPRSPTGGEDDDGVEVIHILFEPELIPSPRLRMLTTMPRTRRPIMAVHIDVERGKALMIPRELEKDP